MSSTLDKLRRARTAAPNLALLTSQQKNAILEAMAQLLAVGQETAGGNSGGHLFPDPVGEVLAEWVRPNGLRMRKVRVPLGVVGVILSRAPM